MGTIALPPTPSDFEAVEQVQRWLAHIKSTTEEVTQRVADHAYTSFPEHEAASLLSQLVETETFCRRMQHALTRCNPRAVAAAEQDGARLRKDGDEPARSLEREATIAAEHFALVARAARSVLSQTRHAPLANAPPRRDVWDELFDLRAGDASAVLQPRSPLRPPDPPSTPAGSSSAHEPLSAINGGSDGASMPRAAELGGGGSRRVAARPARPPLTPEVPTPPPQLPPPSAALSLWNARAPAVEDPPVTAVKAMPGTSSVAGQPAGAFDELKADEGGREAAVSVAALRSALARLKVISTRLHAIVAAHVWDGFTDAAAEELRELQDEGGATARSCRHTARLLGAAPHGENAGLEAEAEQAISEYGVALEVAFHTMGQRSREAAAAAAAAATVTLEGGAAPTDAIDAAAGDSPQLQVQTQVSIAPATSLAEEEHDAITTNARLIEEQQSAMRHVAQEVDGIATLFSELGQLVAVQGEEVETVATLADQTAADVYRAKEELEAYAEKKDCAIQ